MTYDLLEKAPKDHTSVAFLKFLRANNVVVEDNRDWLVIQNCKYHGKKKKTWLTAFAKNESRLGFFYLNSLYGHLEWKKKASKDQSVKRFYEM